MSNSEGSRVLCRLEERGGGLVAFVTVDNPSRLNAMNSALMDAFADTVAALAANEDLRALVVTGAGDKAFIGGADIEEMSALADAEAARRFIARLHGCCAAIRAMPVPTIARINGFALGAGLEIAVSCDLRIATDSAIFGMPEVRLGIPSVIEAALLPSLVGWGRARQIVLFGKNFSAEDAMSWGLVEELASRGALDDAIERWLDQLLACPPGAVRLQKQLVRSWESMPLNAAIEAGIESFVAAVQSGEPAVAMRDFIERRAARKGKR